MAARNNLPHVQKTRERIKASMLINRLEDHVFGKVDMSASQVTAALGLIRKVVPDLQAVEMTAEVTERRIISAEPMGLDDWQTKYGSGVESSAGAAEKSH